MADKKTRPHTTANPEYAKAMAELRRSGAAGTHADKRTRRTRTRSAARDAAIRDSRQT